MSAVHPGSLLRSGVVTVTTDCPWAQPGRRIISTKWMACAFEVVKLTW
jgi:hypothetical protein